jgi:hypothetical protein
MQPGALPASQHHFENNMTALALATVLEGCIGETLSALELAAEVDDTAAVGVDDKLTELLMKNTETIALDEGRHSSLAWRTIHWVCCVDSDACNTVQRQIFGVSTLTEAVSKRLPLVTLRFRKHGLASTRPWCRLSLHWTEPKLRRLLGYTAPPRALLLTKATTARTAY